MLIRPAERLDTPELIAFLKDLTVKVDEKKASYIIDVLTQDPVNQTLLFLVAEDKGEVVGTVMMERVQDLWTDHYIVAKRFFYVRPDYRETRVGAKLIQRVLQWSEEIPSIMRIELEPRAVADIGHGLDKRGYRPVSTVYGLEV